MSRRTGAERDALLRQMHTDGATVLQMAQALKVKRRSILQYLSDLGLPANRDPAHAMRYAHKVAIPGEPWDQE